MGPSRTWYFQPSLVSNRQHNPRHASCRSESQQFVTLIEESRRDFVYQKRKGLVQVRGEPLPETNSLDLTQPDACTHFGDRLLGKIEFQIRVSRDKIGLVEAR